MEFLVDAWLDDLWLVLKIIVVLGVATVYVLHKLDK
jgi:hypothetical protein